MTKTATDEAIKAVREAQSAITKRLKEPGLSSELWEALQGVLETLQECDTCLLQKSLKESLETIDQYVVELRAVQERATKQLGKVNKIVGSIETVAKALDSVVKAVRDVA